MYVRLKVNVIAFVFTFIGRVIPKKTGCYTCVTQEARRYKISSAVRKGLKANLNVELIQYGIGLMYVCIMLDYR